MFSGSTPAQEVALFTQMGAADCLSAQFGVSRLRARAQKRNFVFVPAPARLQLSCLLGLTCNNQQQTAESTQSYISFHLRPSTFVLQL